MKVLQYFGASDVPDRILTTLIEDKNMTTQRMSANALRSPDHIFVKLETKRITTSARRVLFKEEEDIVTDLIKTCYEMGNPYNVDDLFFTLNEMKWSNNDFREMLNDAHRRKMWLRRFLARIQYSVRKSSIGQVIPSNWRELAITDSTRIQAKMKGVDRVIAMDETFHLAQNKVIVPTGVKRVGTINPAHDERKGVTLVVAAEVYSSKLLPPFIVDNGEFGASLMTKWQAYKKSVVVFNKTHWMTQHIFVIFLAWLKTIFPEEKIATTGQDILVEYITEGMTAIHQVGDITINRPLKAKIRHEYNVRRWERKKSLSAGEVHRVDRSELVDIIECAYQGMIRSNIKNRWIESAFETCGIHRMRSFAVSEKYLAALELNSAYSVMLSASSQLVLE
ncbi:hypothetical protein AC1031_018462 [Aphanomyces cochlioides]|nr:hypothetical protein AC1031_018462 [Aphanomyces cochlioides]